MLRSKRKVTNDERRFYERDPWSNNTFPEINAMIKKLDKRELTKKLYSIGLDQRGDKPKLAKRLKMHYKKIFCDEKSTEDVHVACKYFVCIDFEATCERNNTFNYPRASSTSNLEKSWASFILTSDRFVKRICLISAWN